MKSVFKNVAVKGLILCVLFSPFTVSAENIKELNQLEENSQVSPRRSPLNLSIAINLESDINSKELKAVQEAVFAAVTMLRAEDTVSLLNFGNSTRRLLAPSSVNSSQVLLKSTRKLTGEEGVDIFVAVSKASREILTNFSEEKKHHIIVILSNAVKPDSSPRFDLKRLIQSLKQDTISLSLICLGDKASKALSTRAAADGISCKHSARRVSELKKLLENELITLGAQS